MTTLSPAANAVSNAAKSSLDWEAGYLPNAVAAAALRAAADQVVPDCITWASPVEQARHWPSVEERAGQQGEAWRVRRQLFNIAAELDGTQPTSESD